MYVTNVSFVNLSVVHHITVAWPKFRMSMIVHTTTQLVKQMEQLPALSRRWFISLPVRFSILQLIIAAIVGTLIGIYVAVISAFYPPGWLRDLVDISRTTWKFLLVMAVIAPFAGLVITKVIFGNLRRLLLAVVLIDIAAQIDKSLMTSDQALRFGSIGGLSFSITTISLIILYVWWAVDVFSKRSPSPLRSLSRFNPSLLAYILIITLSMFVASNMALSIFELNLVIHGALVYFYVAYTTRSQQDVLFVIVMLLIGLIPFSLITIWLSLVGRLKEPYTAVTGSGISRVDGPMGSPNVAGSYIMMILLPVFSVFAVMEVRNRYKWLVAVAIALGGFAVLTTGSRGAWGGLAITILLLCWLLWRRGWLPLKIPTAYLIIAMLITLPFYKVILERLWSDSSASTAESRAPLNALAVQMIMDHPMLGVGSNNFAETLPQYVNAEFAGLWINTVHNKYLLVCAETGIVGLIAFVGFLLTVLSQGWQVWKGSNRFLATFALGFSLAIVGAMIHMAVAQYHARVQIQMICLSAGMVTALYNTYQSESHLDPLNAHTNNSGM